MLANVVRGLPSLRDSRGRCVTTNHTAERIVEPHLIIEKIEATMCNVTAIFLRIVHFRNELHGRGLLLHLRNGIMPKLYGHHLRHVTTESIDSLFHPEEQNVSHLLPRVGNGVEMACTSADIIHTVVEFHGFVPVVAAGPRIKEIIPGGFSRHFEIRITRCGRFHKIIGMQRLAPTIIEVIANRKRHFAIVVGAQIALSLRCCV